MWHATEKDELINLDNVTRIELTNRGQDAFVYDNGGGQLLISRVDRDTIMRRIDATKENR